MVVTSVQDYIAAGQFRGGEQLVEAQQVTQPGTILVFLEPLYKGGLDGVTPGSSCIANAYSNNHELIASKDTGALRGIALHTVDALALVHALILRLQALVLQGARVRRTLTLNSLRKYCSARGATNRARHCFGLQGPVMASIELS